MTRPAVKAVPLKYRWERTDDDRFDCVQMGEPDFFAYIIRYWSERWKHQAWCWILTMPRASTHTYRGWADDQHKAKRDVEKFVQENWI